MISDWDNSSIHELRQDSVLLTEDSSYFPFISIVDMDLKIMEDCVCDCVVHCRRLTHSLILEIFEQSVWTDRWRCGIVVAWGRLAGCDIVCVCVSVKR